MVAEQFADHLGFAGPHQAVVDEDARQLVADRGVHDRGAHGAVHPAGQGTEHLPVAHLSTNLVDHQVDVLLDGALEPGAGGQ